MFEIIAAENQHLLMNGNVGNPVTLKVVISRCHGASRAS